MQVIAVQIAVIAVQVIAVPDSVHALRKNEEANEKCFHLLLQNNIFKYNYYNIYML
jgi:hypothetical protein